MPKHSVAHVGLYGLTSKFGVNYAEISFIILGPGHYPLAFNLPAAGYRLFPYNRPKRPVIKAKGYRGGRIVNQEIERFDKRPDG